MWIELIPGWTFPEEREDFPPSMIRCETPLTPADGILLLVGAECFLEGVAMEWEVSVYEFGLSMITYRHAMYRIRRDQLAEYLRPVKT